MMEHTPETLHNAAMHLLAMREWAEDAGKQRNDLLSDAYGKLREAVTAEEREALRDAVFILTTLWQR